MVQFSPDRYLEQAKVEDLRREWEAKGFRAIPSNDSGDIEADLVMGRDGEIVVFEVKTGASLARSGDSIARMAEKVLRRPNASFHLVVTNPPRERTIEIDALGESLLRHLWENTFDELDQLSSYTSVEAVDDVDVLGVAIHPGEINARGTAAVTVRLQYGSDSDQDSGDGSVSHASFPFEFDVVLDSQLQIIDVRRLVFDTSSFW